MKHDSVGVVPHIRGISKARMDHRREGASLTSDEMDALDEAIRFDLIES